MSRLEEDVVAGRALGKLALFFGCSGQPGHYLHNPSGRTIWDAKRDLPGFPWSGVLLDAGLLKNGRPKVCDGKVYWTCGGAGVFWYAFYWWDRSGDSRSNSNSGFYVRGFDWPEPQAAFDYACAIWPNIVSRQQHALDLQEPNRFPSGKGDMPMHVARELAGIAIAAMPSDDWRPIAEYTHEIGKRVLVGWYPAGGFQEHVELGRFREGTAPGWCNTYGKSFSGTPDVFMELPAVPSPPKEPV